MLSENNTSMHYTQKQVLAQQIADQPSPERRVHMLRAAYYDYKDLKLADGISEYISIDNAYQWTFTTKKTCLKDLVHQALDDAGRIALNDATFKVCLPYEFAQWTKLKALNREQRQQSVQFTDLNTSNTRAFLIAKARATLDHIYKLRSVSQPRKFSDIAWLLPCQVYNSASRPCELCRYCERTDNHINARSDFEVFPDWTVIQKNGSKGGAQVREPHHKILMMPPELSIEILDVWFEENEQLRVSASHNAIVWLNHCRSKSQPTRLDKMLAQVEFHKLVSVRDGDHLKPYDFRRLGIATLPLVHDVSGVAQNQDNANVIALRVQGGHEPGSSCPDDYRNIAYDEASGVTPRVLQLEVHQHKFVVMEYESGMESDDDVIGTTEMQD